MWEFYLEVLCLCEELSGGYLEFLLLCEELVGVTHRGDDRGWFF
jgi:hypothetical protein